MSDGSKVRVYDKQGRYVGNRSGDLAANTSNLTAEESAALAKRNEEARKKAESKPGLGAIAKKKPKVDAYKPQEPFS